MAQFSIIEWNTQNTFERDSDLLAQQLLNIIPVSCKVITIASQELEFTVTESFREFHTRSGLLNCC